LARYADTHGGAAIGFKSFPFSYTYRDYVVRAFNQDIPYDRFVRQQLAADQLGLSDSDPSLAALGFLTVGMQYRNRNDTIDDQIDVISRGLMGLTVSCARCHDHKFDPIPTRDYYALYAALGPSQAPDELPVLADHHAQTQARREYEDHLNQLRLRRDDLVRDQCEAMRSRLRMQAGMYLKEIIKGMPEQDLSTEFLSYRTDDLRPLVYNRWLAYLGHMEPSDPVFGPWVQLRAWEKLNPDEFIQRCGELIDRMEKELSASKVAPDKRHALGSDPPVWNPIVVDALKQRRPLSMLDVADVYGQVLARENRRWLESVLQSTLEAAPEGTVVPDDSAEHQVINSPVHRQLRHHLMAPDTPTAIPDHLAMELTNRTINDLIGGKKGAIHQWDLTATGSPPRAMVLREEPEPGPYFVFRRGDPLARGERVTPGFLSALAMVEGEFRDGQRRLGLANAVVSSHNPLARRVLVNWVWQHHFGVGLVRTPDDFGTRGQAPTHPELLDYLADQFLRDGWSIKSLHRRILLTRAYRQGAVENEAARRIDPDNQLLWRMPRRRLDFEAMRDAMLLVAGDLDEGQPGGRPFDWSATPEVPKRSLYGFINRDVVSDLLSTFDAANPNACTAKRPETSVPQQTLFALNSAFIQDRAARLETITRSPQADIPSRVETLYRRILARAPIAKELAWAAEFVDSRYSTEETASQPASPQRWAQLAHALLASNEFLFLD
jgi:hypothetical protein